MLHWVVQSRRNASLGLRAHLSRPVPLRDHNSYSVVLGVFHNAGYDQTVTLAQVFYWKEAQGQPARFFVGAEHELSIAADFSRFGADITQLRKRLRDMPADRFEALIGELLIAIGFDEATVEVTRYGGDGGIDVRGVLSAGGVTEVNAAVQAKRWKRNIQVRTVRELRGSLTAHEQGIIITTSDFSSGARKEAAEAGKTDTVARIDKLMKKEQSRYERTLQRMEKRAQKISAPSEKGLKEKSQAEVQKGKGKDKGPGKGKGGKGDANDPDEEAKD